MKYYIGNTDYHWFDFLRNLYPAPDDINFWQPGGTSSFKVLKDQGAPFLLRLKSPINKVAGIGFFASHSILPINYAWEVFGNKNGVGTYVDLRKKINSYRHSYDLNDNPNIGCIILSNPIFLDEKDWIDVPDNWSNSIVQGKSYDTDDIIGIGNSYWERRVSPIICKYNPYLFENQGENCYIYDDREKPVVDTPKYTKYLTNVRIGQGAFRVLVTDAYKRRCAISGEKTLPVLEAAHIQSYSSSGVNETRNGILLRADIHKLYDTGYITITDKYDVEVSNKIREEFENGRDYYKYHGSHMLILPDSQRDLPDKKCLRWHNENIFRG